jgi:hypothetical protein
MTTRVKQIGLMVFAVVAVGVGVAAQLEERPHPIFTGLKVGDRIDIRWNGITGDRVGSGAVNEPVKLGGFEIYNYNGICKVIKLGPDYIIFEKTGKAYAVHINQIRLVTIR